MLSIFILSAFFLFKEQFSISEISEDEELIAEVADMVIDTDCQVEEKRL